VVQGKFSDGIDGKSRRELTLGDLKSLMGSETALKTTLQLMYLSPEQWISGSIMSFSTPASCCTPSSAPGNIIWHCFALDDSIK
jgi:hypothetical protein